MKEKKAVFFDIDGTIWDRDKYIPESTRKAIRLLREKDVYTFISSGRTKACIRDPNLLALGFDGILAGCGTYVESGGEELFYKTIEPWQLRESIEILRNHQMPVVLEGKEYMYFDAIDYENDPLIKFLKKDLGVNLQNFSEYDVNKEISKFTAIIVGEEFTKALKELEHWYEFMVHEKRVIECVPKGFNKSTGIQVICEKLGIAHENTYAFGDSANDLDMLKYVAHGIAMGDGTPEAKDAADYITKGLHQDGIYYGMQHYGLI